MKKIYYLLLIVLCFACNSEEAGDCFQTAGVQVEREVEVSSFEKILVNRNIELILNQGPDYKARIETGQNLLNDIEVNVVDNQLQLTDNNICNMVRDYGNTKIYVTAPNLTEIRSSTQYDISSDGVLDYHSLKLLSEDFGAPESFTTGDFRLELNTSQLRVVSNNLSSFYISGQTENLNLYFASGAGRFEAQDLMVKSVDIYHRGTNDMVVNPQEALKVELRSSGNVIAYNEPLVVELEQYYTGQLLFAD